MRINWICCTILSRCLCQCSTYCRINNSLFYRHDYLWKLIILRAVELNHQLIKHRYWIKLIFKRVINRTHYHKLASVELSIINQHVKYYCVLEQETNERTTKCFEYFGGHMEVDSTRSQQVCEQERSRPRPGATERTSVQK